MLDHITKDWLAWLAAGALCACSSGGQSGGGGSGGAAAGSGGQGGTGGAANFDGCVKAGGVCACVGSCPTGYSSAPAPLAGQCPQPPPNSGACGMGCCLPEAAGGSGGAAGNAGTAGNAGAAGAAGGGGTAGGDGGAGGGAALCKPMTEDCDTCTECLSTYKTDTYAGCESAEPCKSALIAFQKCRAQGGGYECCTQLAASGGQLGSQLAETCNAGSACYAGCAPGT